MAAISHADVAAAGRLIGWAARPRERVTRHADYAALVERYFDDSDFAELVHAYAAGLDVDVSVERGVGVIAVAEPDSAFRVTAAMFGSRVGAQVRRPVIAAALLGVFRVAFPAPAHLDDPLRVPRVSVATVVAYLNALAQRFIDDADDETADQVLRPVWREWARLPQARAGAERASLSTQMGVVNKVCDVLESEGMLARRIELDGGTWTATARLRAAARALAEDSDVYAAVCGYESTPDDLSVLGGVAPAADMPAGEVVDDA